MALLLSDLTPKIVYFSFVLFFEIVNLIFLFPQPVEEKNLAKLSLAMETMATRLSVVKQSFFGPPGQYGRLVTRANMLILSASYWVSILDNAYTV